MKKRYFELREISPSSEDVFGIPTGTKLDEMFYRVEKIGNRFIKRPLGGIPYLSILNLTGIPDTGKSVLVEQFAITQASRGYRVLFVTVENPAEFLYSALKQKCNALNMDFSKVEGNIIVIDVSQDDELRENPAELIDTMAYAIKEKKTSVCVIDSITGLYEHKEVMARLIVRRFFNFLKKFKQTGILVSQKRSTQAGESAEAAGGLAVAHIVDGTIILDKKLIDNRWDMNLYKLPLGSVLRTIRIDGCRLALHDPETWIFKITELGTIDIISPLKEYISEKEGVTHGGN